MKKIPITIEITAAEYVGDFRLVLTFSDGKKHTVDFAPFLKNAINPEVKKYLKPNRFKRYTIKNGDLMWGDFDLIFPLADLYEKNIIS